MTKKKFNYSKSLKEIEDILASLEGGEIEVDKLVEKVNRATALINDCRNALKSVEQDLEQSLNKLDDN